MEIQPKQGQEAGKLFYKPYGVHDSDLGANSYFYGYHNPETGEHTRIAVDWGTLLGEMGEYSTILPNNLEDIRQADALFVTHAHADHMRGLAHAPVLGVDIRSDDLKIYGMPLVQEGTKMMFIQERVPIEYWSEKKTSKKGKEYGDFIFERGTRNNADLDPGGTTTVKDLEVESIRVGHSIPARGFWIKAPNGASVFHTGDMRMCQDGENTTDRAALKRVAEEASHVVSDTTHWKVPGKNGDAEPIHENIRQLFEDYQGRRILIGGLSSSLSSLDPVIDRALAQDRLAIIHGDYMNSFYKLMKKAGHVYSEHEKELDADGKPRVVDSKSPQAQHADPANTAVFTTGGYLDERGQLRRILENDQPNNSRLPSVREDDVFVILRPPYPEMKEWQEMEQGIETALARGATVVMHGNPDSGPTGELKKKFPDLDMREISAGGHMKEAEAREFLQTLKGHAEAVGRTPPTLIFMHTDQKGLEAGKRICAEEGYPFEVVPEQAVAEFKPDGGVEIVKQGPALNRYIGVKPLPREGARGMLPPSPWKGARQYEHFEWDAEARQPIVGEVLVDKQGYEAYQQAAKDKDPDGWTYRNDMAEAAGIRGYTSTFARFKSLDELRASWKKPKSELPFAGADTQDGDPPKASRKKAPAARRSRSRAPAA